MIKLTPNIPHQATGSEVVKNEIKPLNIAWKIFTPTKKPKKK